MGRGRRTKTTTLYQAQQPYRHGATALTDRLTRATARSKERSGQPGCGERGRTTVVSLSIERGAHESAAALLRSPFLALHRHLAALRQTRSRVRTPLSLSLFLPAVADVGGWWGWNEHVGRPSVVGEVAKYVVEMGWPMNAVGRGLERGILLIFFPPRGGWWSYARAPRLIKRPERGLRYARLRGTLRHADGSVDFRSIDYLRPTSPH